MRFRLNKISKTRLVNYVKCSCAKSFLRFTFYVLSLSTIFSCGEWGWQKVEYDYDPQLNVFGMIILGEGKESFVIVQQSLDLQTNDIGIAGYDTTYYGPDSTYDLAITRIDKEAFVVDDATVYITDGTDTAFFFMPPLDSEHHWIYETKYSDTLRTFIPRPNTTYTLHVSTPDGRLVTGELTTPELPHIHSTQIPDTVYNEHRYTIPFRPIYDKDAIVRIRTGPVAGYMKCCMNQTTFIDYGDTTWTSTVEDCSDWWWDEEPGDNIRIELQVLDPNYYDYFVKNSKTAEYINFIMGNEGSSGKGFGLKGGMGVFGAISIDAVERFYIP